MRRSRYAVQMYRDRLKGKRSIMEPNFHSLDREFDSAMDVAKGDGEDGTFYFQTNSPQGHCCARIWMHPHMARRLRDWLIENYPKQDGK